MFVNFTLGALFHNNSDRWWGVRALPALYGGDVALFIAFKWRHSDVIIIKLTAFIQNEIPYKTYISDFIVLGK